MYCRHCGKENLDDSIFCEHCGKQLKSPQSAADRLHRLSRHAAQSGVGAEQKKVERPVSLPKKEQRNIQFRGKGRTLVIVVAVILCAALLAFLVSGLETGSLGAKTTRICIMDGRKMTSANYTGDSAGALTISYELFDIDEDGLPSAKYSVTPSAARSGETIVYRYDYDHLVMEYLDYAQRESELTKNEKRRADEVVSKIYKPLESGEIDINEVDGYRLLGIEDGRVAAAFSYYGYDCLIEYDEAGNITKRTNFQSSPSEGLRSIITYSYTDDGKISSKETTSYTGSSSYKFEYDYVSDQEARVRQTVISNGADPVTTEYIEKYDYDINGLIVRKTMLMNGDLLTAAEYRYHYVELEVPSISVELLCNVYDYLGIEYVLEGEGVSVTQTMRITDWDEAWSFFGD